MTYYLQVLQTEKREFEVQLDREKEETRKAKISVNEGKSSKIHLESQLKEARRKMEEDERNRDTEKVSKGPFNLDDFLMTCDLIFNELMNGDGVCRAATGFARVC